MPKLKTRKSVAKRFKISATGKVKRHKAYARHLMTGKTANKRRHLRKDTAVSPADAKNVKTMLPYS